MRIKIENKAGINVTNNFEIDFHDAVDISSEMNEFLGETARQTTAAELYAINLIGQIFRHIFINYLTKANPDIFTVTMEYAGKEIGKTETKLVLDTFAKNFPPRGNPVEELLVLRLTNENPACSPYSIIFDELVLIENTAYLEMMEYTYTYLKNVKGPGGADNNIIDFLKEPVRAHPDSLLDQLEYIAKNWKSLLGDKFQLLLRGLDFLKEERKPHFPPGPGPVEPYTYDNFGVGPEGFSIDLNWMPNVVMMAKSTLVWLDQLSKQYKTSITRLDQIPDQELDVMSARGFSALWLIGLWERSSASRQIKQACGNPEAESSAYSLKRYEIAEELGGWQSLSNLKQRCAARGIRLASDMVPNHTGIDSDWVTEHPDWFLQLPYPPYPNYSYNSQNLSQNPNLGLYIEDHYYNQTDAAVTFKRIDFRNGDERYIYHGNDGTSMPWNDTAQLNYLNPETREAIIQTILHVARNFSIIRFDAAMTLAKKHIQRLWFPEPGSGGDIPTRSEKGLSRAEFNKAIPIEFWREVVDRIKAEAPDTLLLAEAFWMMEGYFVKNLGMHRVYNSAFMNMLKMEENQKYKETIKNTLIYDPEILKRFVNFMNNPDEDTAALQFGMGDKYFGVCTMLATMPGLPMFGHGQIEGFKEKYGMEYRKAYHNEIPDTNFIERHNREIFPLIKKRYLFSESENFQLFDLYNREGYVNENVFAWLNSKDNEFAIVFYNNSFTSATGWIHSAAPKKNQPETDVGSALRLRNSPEYYCLFKEERSGLTFIRNSQQIHNGGIYLHLNGYECQVFMDFREIFDKTGMWKELSDKLNGQGIIDINRAFRQITLEEASNKLSDIFQEDMANGLQAFVSENEIDNEHFLNIIQNRYLHFLTELELISNFDKRSIKSIDSSFKEALGTLGSLGKMKDIYTSQSSPLWLNYIFRGFGLMPEVWTLLLAWVTLAPLSKLVISNGNDISLFNIKLTELIEDLNIKDAIKQLLSKAGIDESHHHELFNLILIISSREKLEDTKIKEEDSQLQTLQDYFDNPLVADFIGRNYHQNIEWFKRESFQLFAWWIFALEALEVISEDADSPKMNEIFKMTQLWLEGEEHSECQIKLLFNSTRKS